MFEVAVGVVSGVHGEESRILGDVSEQANIDKSVTSLTSSPWRR